MGGATYFVTFHLRNGLDAGAAGLRPLVESERAVAKHSLLFWHGKHWSLHALTIMPDHVHLLATPLACAPEQWHALPPILKSAKKYSSSQINLLRGERGSLWQEESFDRLVRNAEEYEEKLTYIIENAVRAGLVDDPWEWDGLWYEGRDG
jgi:REP element-mobilizing transposase RayT